MQVRGVLCYLFDAGYPIWYDGIWHLALHIIRDTAFGLVICMENFDTR